MRVAETARTKWHTRGMASRTASPLVHPQADEIDFATVLRALADPTRLGIVTALAGCEGAVQCSRFVMPVGKTAASHHFRILREAGILRQVDEATRRLNSLRRRELDARFPGLLDLAITRGSPACVQIMSE
jgi:DNA-binding transcriptional ArsR family regulator